MIEVGIASVEAVFDWRSYIKKFAGKGMRRYDISGSI